MDDERFYREEEAKKVKGEIYALLEDLGCGEPHGTGFGCCRCSRNDLIEMVKQLLTRLR